MTGIRLSSEIGEFLADKVEFTEYFVQLFDAKILLKDKEGKESWHEIEDISIPAFKIFYIKAAKMVKKPLKEREAPSPKKSESKIKGLLKRKEPENDLDVDRMVEDYEE